MKKTERKIVLKAGRYLKLVKECGWEYVERLRCSGIVIILALTDDKKIVFTEQYRLPVKKNVIEYPAGLVGDRRAWQEETIVAAAKRELLEETGYRARKVIRLTSGPSSSGASAVILTFVWALGIKKIHKGGGDSSEAITVHEVPMSQVEKWLERKRRKGCLVDPKIYAGLYFLNKYNYPPDLITASNNIPN